MSDIADGKARNFHMGLSVRGVLRHSPREMKRDLKWIFRDDGTRFSSVDELRNEFLNELAQGHETIPMSSECDNWDYKTGCRGHEVEK